MNQWNSADEILDFAIGKEEEAAQFYMDLAGTAQTAPMRTAFEEFAREEQGHKSKLEGVKLSGSLTPATGKVIDLQLADYLVDVDPTEEMDYQHALILAMKQEKAAFKLYNDLAAATDDPELRSLLEFLAQEEAKHKLRFEIEYDDYILREN